MQPPTGAILLIKWNVLTLPYTYQYLKVRGCEGLGAGIPKDSLNSGRQGSTCKYHLRALRQATNHRFHKYKGTATGHFGMGLPSPKLHLATLT